MIKFRILVFALFTCVFIPESFSEVKIRYNNAYEDSLRVLIIYNSQADGVDACPDGTNNTGENSKNSVLYALNSIPYIEIRKSKSTTWEDVKTIWSPNLPHVIIHVNAGDQGQNGPSIASIIDSALSHDLGIVFVGDDAASLGENVFGITNVVNGPSPMSDAMQYRDANDELWITLDGKYDVLQEPGIIKNTLEYVLTKPRIYFKPFVENGRCQADPAVFQVKEEYREHLTFMGHQQAYDASTAKIIGNATELPVIMAYGDSSRRAVSLVFQPQYIQEKLAKEQIIYDAVIWASYPRYKIKLPAPVISLADSSLEGTQEITISAQIPTADIYYSLNESPFIKYNGNLKTLTGSTTIHAYIQKEGYLSSDTVSESYSRTSSSTTLSVSDLQSQYFGNNITLTNIYNKFIFRIVTPLSTKDHSINIHTTINGDKEMFSINNYTMSNEALIFLDTFVVTASNKAHLNNTVIEADIYDTVSISYSSSRTKESLPVCSFPFIPVFQQGTVYLATKDGNYREQITGEEDTIYLVLEDQPFHPAKHHLYKLNLENDKADNNISPPDKENFSFTEIKPGKYICRIPLAPSSPVTPGNGVFEYRDGDIFTATYTDPVDGFKVTKTFGTPEPQQIPGIISFTSEDYQSPVKIMTNGAYDASIGKIYLRYEDDYVSAITKKSIEITVSSVDALGRQIVDRETVSMNSIGKVDGTGIWILETPLVHTKIPVLGDSILQFFFAGQITVEVPSHRSGSGIKLSGDSTKAVLNIFYPNTTEIHSDTTELQFASMQNEIITEWDYAKNAYIKVQVKLPTPSSSQMIIIRDAIRVLLTTDFCDSLSPIFKPVSGTPDLYEAMVKLAFTNSPDITNNVLEGRIAEPNIESTMEINASYANSKADLHVSGGPIKHTHPIIIVDPIPPDSDTVKVPNTLPEFISVPVNYSLFIQDSILSGNIYGTDAIIHHGIHKKLQSIDKIHIALTYEKKDRIIKLFVNGIPVAIANGPDQPFQNDLNTIIGTDSKHGFKGLIDNLKIYNNALSADSIKAIYNSHFSGTNYYPDIIH
ncbi:MAG: hypothetical protein HQK83_08565 [Fibrobacteria bacterium]|nr:hypothetical protein [Fibrobacteria bacterium]